MRAGMVIEGRFPSLNDYVDAERANRHVGAKMKRRETARAEAAAIAQGLPRFAGPVAVRFLWVEPRSSSWTASWPRACSRTTASATWWPSRTPSRSTPPTRA